MPNVLISSEIVSGRRTMSGHPQLIEYVGICVLSLAHGSELRGSDIYFHIVHFFFNLSLNSARIRVLGKPLLGILSGFFF